MRPMLAADAEADKIRFPVLASVKVDGVRAVIRDGIAYSRTLKPIPNRFIQAWVTSFDGLLDGFDGELVVGEENANDVMQKTMSGVMSKDKQPNFKYMVFDLWDSPQDFTYRIDRLAAKVNVARSVRGAGETYRLQRLEQFRMNSSQELDAFEAKALGSGFEGVMIRDPNGIYKHGRSTVKEGILLKVKRFVDGEAEVIGVEEQMHNANAAEINELGRTKRSTAKSGLVPAGVLGTLIGSDLVTGVTVRMGTGFTAAQRKELWDAYQKHSPDVLGAIAKYKSFTATGVKNAPRFTVFRGFRDAIDIGEA